MAGNVTSIDEAAIAKFAQQVAVENKTSIGDSEHFTISQAWIQHAVNSDGEHPVASMGSVFRHDPNSQLWIPSGLERIALDVGRLFPGKNCKKASDYRQIASLVASHLNDDDFFVDAPSGVAAGMRFWRVTRDGDIVSESLSAAHRQRMHLAFAPDFQVSPVKLLKLLDNAFGCGDAGDAQRELLQMALGAALTGSLWRYRTVVMLFGGTSTGKSTILDVLRAFFPASSVGATNPQSWGNEYHAASLAGRALNIVGELDPTTPIAGGIFKAVTGGDVVEGRHPTHRPFSFICTASHVFNCNRLPPTRDKSDAFFRRWRILEFANPVAPGAEVIGLADQIVQEEQAAVLAWLLDGAARLAQRGALPETENHKRLISYWRAANNSALQFLLDAEYVDLTATHSMKAQDAFAAYRKWSQETGVKALGRNSFYEAIQDGGARHGIAIADDRDGVKTIRGVSLKQ